jgi:hypothetical protein
MEGIPMKFLNESSIDRIIRVIVGIVLLGLGWFGFVTGGWGLAFKILGLVFLLTGVVGFCPIYALLKIRTKSA